ncbi:hypothetical protein F5888DRAFT_412633 [Russula emetica]|nr:hypothetical protein F5888DRAFT_412633 [Russula emetica]
MLDFDPFAPVYSSHVQDNDSLFRFKAMQADPIAYSSYSPSPITLGKFAYKSPSTPPTPSSASSPGLQSFTFDPFADEDSSTSSVASERERELVVQRLRRIEFLRRREWMRRVVAWVDGISQDTSPTLSPSSALSMFASPPRPHNYTHQSASDPADSPTLYYSSSLSPSSQTSRSDEDDEPYLIYSTPLPGSAQPPFYPPSPSPSPPVSKSAAPAPVHTPTVSSPHISPPPLPPSSRRIHGRMRSLSSIPYRPPHRPHIHPIEQSIHTSHTSINDPFNYRTRQMFRFIYFLPCSLWFFLLSFLPFLSAYLLPQVYCTTHGNCVSLASARL